MPRYNIIPGERVSLGIDCASRPYGPAVRNSPYSTICRYLSDGGEQLPGKQLLPDEAASYLEHDIALVSNWESWADRMREGEQAGREDAGRAGDWHNHCGGPDHGVIYFSCDYDAPEGDQGAIDDYLRACIDVLGADRVGLYGGYWPLSRAKVAMPSLRLWQTLAWSGSNRCDGLNMLQRIGFVTVGGAQCDVNEIHTPGGI